MHLSGPRLCIQEGRAIVRVVEDPLPTQAKAKAISSVVAPGAARGSKPPRRPGQVVKSVSSEGGAREQDEAVDAEQELTALSSEGEEPSGAGEEESSLDGGESMEDEAEPLVEGEEEPGEHEESEQGSRAIVLAPRVLPAAEAHDPLTLYLREIEKHPLLTPEETTELATRYAETQDVRAAARLVTANLRLVVKIAYEYRRAYKNVMDLVQEGNIGLMQAVKKFDPHRGVKLSTYSAWWIRAYILKFIVNNWRLVKVGTTQAQRKLFFNLNKEKARLSALGIEPSAAELAKRIGVTEGEASEMDRRMSAGESSLDAPVGDGDTQTARVDLIPSPGERVDDLLAEEELHRMVRQRLDEFRKTLSGKEVDIFDRRIDTETPLTLQELGELFHISRERVRQLETALLARLRAHLSATIGDAVQVAG